ncbi:MAG TPA: dynamin family protein [Chloroflexia bacterium]|nr:dynamin family protein [Chloroflexia bacterium]
MTNPGVAGGSDSARVERARQNVLELVDSLHFKQEQLALPALPDALETSWRKLKENEYTILVAGEAKRGKSSFINALIGRPILPTDVDISTSQVFRIRSASYEAYRVRFQDGSTREIAQSDLFTYGSQGAADAGIAPKLNQVIRWIEADLPIKFLPKGVNLLDTPGLGTLYAAHAQITHRFVPQADAVIFVLESGQPILQSELNFLETILGVTRNIFFIQTMIDRYRRDEWETIRERNEAILRDRFVGRLADPSVWPFSSAHLLKAGQTGDNDFYIMSKAKEMWAALQAFLFRVAGWSRLAETLVIAEGYHNEARTIVAKRLTAISAESKQRREESSRTMMKHKTQFDAEWGVRGEKRRELMQAVQKISQMGRTAFSQGIQPSGPTEFGMRERIEAVTSLDEAVKLNDELPGVAASSVLGYWQQITDWALAGAVRLLEPFEGDVIDLSLGLPTGVGANISIRKPALDPDDGDSYRKLREGYGDAIFLSGVASSLTTVVGGIGLIASSVVAPLAIMVGGAAWLFGLFKGHERVREKEVLSAKAQMQRNLIEIMQQIRQHFTYVNITTGQESIVDTFFSQLQARVLEHVEQMAARKSTEVQAEVNRLEEAANMDDTPRKIKVEETRKELEAVDALGQNLRTLVMEVKALARRGPGQIELPDQAIGARD